MGLVERLSTEPEVPIKKCGLGRLLESLTEVEQLAVEDAIGKIRSGDPNDRSAGRHRYTSRWLTKVLNEEGHKISSTTVTTHVAKDCRCGS